MFDQDLTGIETSRQTRQGCDARPHCGARARGDCERFGCRKCRWCLGQPNPSQYIQFSLVLRAGQHDRVRWGADKLQHIHRNHSEPARQHDH